MSSSTGRENLIRGLRGLRNGALLVLISVVLYLIMVVVVAATMGYAFASMAGDLNMAAIATAGPLIGSAAALVIVASTLVFVAFILWFTATGRLKAHNAERFGIGRLGMILQLLAKVIVIVGVMTLAAALIAAIPPHAPPSPTALAGVLATIMGAVVAFIVAAILLFIGAILFGLMLRRLPEEEGVDSGFRTAGLLYIIGLILVAVSMLVQPLAGLGFIGLILLLVSVILIYHYANVSLERIA